MAGSSSDSLKELYYFANKARCWKGKHVKVVDWNYVQVQYSKNYSDICLIIW